ncbi:MAG: hypothetical protein NDJ18_06620 [candidate division Zixibacteria bacterium]|nr:hypothetical protein [candidate division Zixibacteria bacterium]
MKLRLFLPLLLILASATAFAQAEPASPAGSFEAFRPIGESRVWTFEVDRQTIGSLTSTVTGKTEIDGIDGYVIQQDLRLDFAKAGSEIAILAEGEQYISERGYYLGCDLKLTINGQMSELTIERDGERLDAVVKGSTGTTENAIPFPVEGFGYESFFVDLFELYFAMHGAEVGQTYLDTLFSVQSMLPVNFSALCLDYKWQGLFTGKYDSVFVLNVTLPENFRLYLNKSFHLAKAEMPDRKLKIYQDYVGPARGRQQPQEPGFTVAGLTRSLPVLPVYLAFAALVLAVLAWHGLRSKYSYLGFVAGSVAFILIPFILHPIQKWVVDSVVIPGAQRGESLYMLALLPAITAGLLITSIFAIALHSLRRAPWGAAIRPDRLGAFFGAGFGVAESVLLATTIPSSFLFSMMLFERAAFVILFTLIGALVGRALFKDSHAIVKALIGSVLVVTLFKYLPILVQQRIVELALMYILALLIALILLGLVVIIFAREKAAAPGRRK